MATAALSAEKLERERRRAYLAFYARPPRRRAASRAASACATSPNSVGRPRASSARGVLDA